jgi:asparagine synthase (glutamine-hydrolysing)
MCGFVGIYRGDGEPVRESDLRGMAAALAHRGPDDEGVYVDGALGLAHRRLAILDLTPAGRQPMPNEDGSVWVVYNGQLFGFQPLREWLESRGHRFRSRTDTEILVHLYEETGEGLVERIDGMFAFALWDARRRRLLLARDRFGIKPLFVYERDGVIAFASELRSLLTVPWIARDIDPVGMAQYLFHSAPIGGASLIRDVRRLDPGEYRVIAAACSRRRYWTMPPEANEKPCSFESATEQLASRLAEAVRSHLVADVPVGVFLSGGLDSSAVAQAASAASERTFHSFSVSFSGSGAIDEGPVAQATADALGTVHHQLRIGPEAVDDLSSWMARCDEPLAVVSAIPLFHLSRFAREHVKVVLTGDGADEILAGYPWRHRPVITRRRPSLSAFAAAAALELVRSYRGARGLGPGIVSQLSSRCARLLREPDAHYASIVAAFTPEELKTVLAADLHDVVDEAWACDPVRRRYRQAQGRDEVNRRLRADLESTLESEMLTKVDRMSMSFGLEARVPFLDRALVEWTMTLPGEYKIRGGIGKRVLRAALADRLPHVAGRPKRGFSPPLAAWLRGPLALLLREVLSVDSLRQRGLYQPSAVRRVVEAHQNHNADWSRKIFTLLVLELWLRGTLKGSPATTPMSAL